MPEITFEKDTFSFDEKSCPVVIGSAANAQLVLPRSEYVAEAHLKIEWNGSAFVVENTARPTVKCNGGKVLRNKERVILKADHFFLFGHESESPLLVYYRGEEAQFEPLELKNPLRNEQEVLVAKFYEGVNTEQIENYLAQFLLRTFPITTAGIIWQDGRYWNNLTPRATRAKNPYRPSVTLLRQFVASRRPVSFSLSANEDPSFSLLVSAVQRAYLLPMLVSGELKGALYIDSQADELSQKDVEKIQYLLDSGVSALVKSRQDSTRFHWQIKDELPHCDFANLRLSPVQNLIFATRQGENFIYFFVARATSIRIAQAARIFLDGAFAADDLDEMGFLFLAEQIEKKFSLSAVEILLDSHGGLKVNNAGLLVSIGDEAIDFDRGERKISKGEKIIVRVDASSSALLEVEVTL